MRGLRSATPRHGWLRVYSNPRPAPGDTRRQELGPPSAAFERFRRGERHTLAGISPELFTIRQNSDVSIRPYRCIARLALRRSATRCADPRARSSRCAGPVRFADASSIRRADTPSTSGSVAVRRAGDSAFVERRATQGRRLVPRRWTSPRALHAARARDRLRAAPAQRHRDHGRPSDRRRSVRSA